MAKKKVVLAKKSVLDEDEFDQKHTKVLISIRLDGNVLQAVKAEAEKRGVKYQPLINDLLKDHFLGNVQDERIRQIVREELGKAS